MKINDVIIALEKIAPAALAESWDNCGLIVGDGDTEVTGILVALDATRDIIASAKEQGCELVVAHHPIIFGGMKKLSSSSPVFAAVRDGISVIAAHTCYDSAENGVGYTLARTIGLSCFAPTEEHKYLYIGDRPFNTSLGLLSHVKNVLNVSDMRYYDAGKAVRKIAVCGGAGENFILEAHNLGADAFITGEGSHHDFLLAAELGMTFIAAGHFETEIISVPVLANMLREQLSDGVKIITAKESSPISTM